MAFKVISTYYSGDGTREARVTKDLKTKTYQVEMLTGSRFSSVISFNTEEEAELIAEDWVL